MIEEILKSKRNKMFELNRNDIELIVRLLSQELDAVELILANANGIENRNEWHQRGDHIEELIMNFLR